MAALLSFQALLVIVAKGGNGTPDTQHHSGSYPSENSESVTTGRKETDMKGRSLHCFQVVGVTLVLAVIFLIGYLWAYVETFEKHAPITVTSPKNHQEQSAILESSNQCPNVLDHMTKGQWQKGKVSQGELKQTESLYLGINVKRGVPASMQTPDGRCGNVDYAATTMPAMCNPRGPTPCCYKFKCVNRTEEQCRCAMCSDVRQAIYAEHSEWIPSDNRCKPRQYNAEQICDLLNGGSIFFVGDISVEHIYTVFLLLLNANVKGGLYRRPLPKGRCLTTMSLFSERYCQREKYYGIVGACNGAATINFQGHYLARGKPSFTDTIIHNLGATRTLFVTGAAIHPTYNTTKMYTDYFRMSFERLNKAGVEWPKVLLVDNNPCRKWGNPSGGSKEFRLELEKFYKSYNIPLLKTCTMTDNVRSFDGTQYGFALNEMKARIILNYIQELHDAGVW